jgi:hypothetical protein
MAELEAKCRRAATACISKHELLHAFPHEHLVFVYDLFSGIGVCESQTVMDLLAIFSLY